MFLIHQYSAMPNLSALLYAELCCFPLSIPYTILSTWVCEAGQDQWGGLKAQYILPCLPAGYLGKQKDSRKILPQGKSASWAAVSSGATGSGLTTCIKQHFIYIYVPFMKCKLEKKSYCRFVSSLSLISGSLGRPYFSLSVLKKAYKKDCETFY